MAIRNIRIMGDEVLGKICKPVKKMTPRTRQLIDDMFDTMYDGCGVGLAANQVGILKRIVVIDTTGENPYVLINPEILETSGSQTFLPKKSLQRLRSSARVSSALSGISMRLSMR